MARAAAQILLLSYVLAGGIVVVTFILLVLGPPWFLRLPFLELLAILLFFGGMFVAVLGGMSSGAYVKGGWVTDGADPAPRFLPPRATVPARLFFAGLCLVGVGLVIYLVIHLA